MTQRKPINRRSYKQQPKKEFLGMVLTYPSIEVISSGDKHLCYKAEVRGKDPSNQMILCNSTHKIMKGDYVMVSQHGGLAELQHSRNFVVSSMKNCSGGFYFLNGDPA